MATYLEMLEKIQSQALENLKQVQAVGVATLHTARELVTTMPTLTSVPTIEALPTLTQITELNTSFATQLLEQQKSYAAALAELFAPPIKSSPN